ncbi:energy transducer TonB [Helicobacter mesocricetorum]|uniref:energy transducer TonB n=1 Tax=Helicobacter mesocricetorum TaxID=87012 RepID=UPI000CF1BC67|nr:energy transducer TonB [Helicobacter mesocricetorum]
MKTSVLPRNSNSTLYSFIMASAIYGFLILSVLIVGKNFTSKEDVGLQTQNLAISLNQFMPDTPQVQPLQPPMPKPIQKINKPLPKKTKPKHHRKEYKMVQPSPQEALEPPIQKVASNPNPTPTNQAPQMLTFGKNNDPFLLAIKQAIDRNLHYPRKARMMRIEGVVTIEFTLLAGGGVQSVKIIKSSGNPILDKSALRTIFDAQESFPSAKNNVIIQIPIQYHLKS